MSTERRILMVQFPAVHFAIVFWRSSGLVRDYALYLNCGGHYVRNSPASYRWVAEDARLSLWNLQFEKNRGYLSDEEIIEYFEWYCPEGSYLGITLSGELYWYRTIDGSRTSFSDSKNIGQSVQIGRIAGIAVYSEGLRPVRYGIEPWMEDGRTETLKALEKIGQENPRVVLDPGVPNEIVWSPYHNRDYRQFDCFYSVCAGGFTRPRYTVWRA